jgi:hypothetical protein
MSFVLPRWRTSPLSFSSRSMACGSGISSRVTSHGPMAEGVAGLALHPLPAAILLIMALGDIIDEHIASHVIQCLILAHAPRRAAHDDAQLHFMIGMA